jgi:hypothetical protein
MLGETEVFIESFKTFYLEDYAKLKEEALELKKEAEEIKRTGDNKAYKQKLYQYDVFNFTADTMLDLAIKYPVAEA